MNKKYMALIAITKNGSAKAREVAQKIPGADLYIAAKFKDDTQAHYFNKVRDLLNDIFHDYSTIVCFISLGAVVRLIAPLLEDKKTDPAVLTIDDAGKYVISVLSGHLGGANEMTEFLAEKIGAQSIVTTASDVGKTIPVDILGRKLGWTLNDFNNVTAVSADVVNEEPVAFVLEAGEKNWWDRDVPLPAQIKVVGRLDEVRGGEFKSLLLVTDRNVSDDEIKDFKSKHVIYRPKTLCLGMGCDTTVLREDMLKLIEDTFTKNGLSMKSIRSISTAGTKTDVPGIKEAAEALKIDLIGYSKDELNSKADMVKSPSAASKFLDVAGVAEPAAMLSANSDNLIVRKVKGSGCTLAVCRMV